MRQLGVACWDPSLAAVTWALRLPEMSGPGYGVVCWDLHIGPWASGYVEARAWGGMLDPGCGGLGQLGVVCEGGTL
eukprot:7588877-Alexandrium_andersonii.AAC.1